MFIQTESTPNPNSLKFILDGHEICSEPVEYNVGEENINSKLAEKLLQIDGIDKILFNKNFISINKSKFTWDQLKATILHEISDFIGSGIPILETENEVDEINTVEFDDADIEVVKNINNILVSKIRPAVMQDGGDIKFKKYDEGIVSLSLQGSCAGCPSATLTLKNGVENMLKHHIPEVKKVEQII
jgi:Fe-S cluster biogenesis protein NfuA